MISCLTKKERRFVMIRSMCHIRVAAVPLLLGMAVVVAASQSPSRPRARVYDPASETKITGTVESVNENTRGPMRGIHLIVKVGDESRTVRLGPSDFLTAKGFSFAKGDSVEVTGSKVSVAGAESIIAREVIKDGKTLTLRDKSGTPQWAPRGRRANKS
jgi:hypothetical protein